MAHKILSTKSPPKFLLGGLYKFIKFVFGKPKYRLRPNAAELHGLDHALEGYQISARAQ